MFLIPVFLVYYQLLIACSNLLVWCTVLDLEETCIYEGKNMGEIVQRKVEF